MRKCNLHKHIKIISEELDLSKTEDDKDNDETEGFVNDTKGMKDLINKKRKTKGKKKKIFEHDEEAMQEQLKLFEESKVLAMNSYTFIDNSVIPAFSTGAKENQIQELEKELFMKTNQPEDEEEDLD